ncbi:hypothetical protein ACFL15_00565 [Patescibacteria group bacterium]
MNTKKLKEHSINTKKQAKILLQSTKLLDILKKYGDVYLIGSYPLNIMYGPDIDIVVESKNIRDNSINALQEIVEKNLFRKIEYGDFVKFPIEKRPKGYILVLKAVVEKVEWEIEVWFLENTSKQLNYNKLLKSKITEQNRIKILKAKHLRDTSKTSKRALSSYEIYGQILGTLNT